MATRTQTTLVAVFRTTAEAEAAAEELQAVGVHRDHILVTSTNAANTYQPSADTGMGYREGGFKGWWRSLFDDDENVNDRKRYENAVNQGNILLSVDTSHENERDVADIINRHKPINLHEQAPNSATTRATDEVLGNSIPTHITIPEETPRKEPPPPGATAARSGAQTNLESADRIQTGNADAVPVANEELKVDKRRVLRGGVRVYSRVVEEPVEERIRLRDEHVRVERRTVDRAAPGADLRPGQEQVIEVKEFGEVPVISKQVRVVEEIHVNKEFSERVETVRETLRHTKVDVQPIHGDQTGGVPRSQMAWTVDPDTDAAFRRDYETNYGSSGQPYDYYADAYRFGYTMSSDPRYRNRRFEDVEADLQMEYRRRNPNSAWDRLKNPVRYGWNTLTNGI